MQHIRLQEVLRSVGLTTGAAYRIWADQSDFHRDLAVEMVGLRFAPPVTSAAIAIQEVLDDPDGTLDDVARVAALDFVTYASKFHLEPESRDSHAFITALALRTAAGAWPELRVASAERHRESIDAFAEFYAALLARYGRRMRSPLTIIDFTEAMAALGEGFAVRAAEGLDHPVYDIPASTSRRRRTARGRVDTVRHRHPRARRRVHGSDRRGRNPAAMTGVPRPRGRAAGGRGRRPPSKKDAASDPNQTAASRPPYPSSGVTAAKTRKITSFSSAVSAPSARDGKHPIPNPLGVHRCCLVVVGRARVRARPGTLVRQSRCGPGGERGGRCGPEHRGDQNGDRNPVADPAAGVVEHVDPFPALPLWSDPMTQRSSVSATGASEATP